MHNDYAQKTLKKNDIKKDVCQDFKGPFTAFMYTAQPEHVLIKPSQHFIPNKICYLKKKNVRIETSIRT